MSNGSRHGRLGQETIILLIAVAVFVIFSVAVPDFLSTGNVVAMVQSVSMLGMLGLGMAITILGRGIDLSMVSSMSIAIAWMLVQLNAGVPLAQALPLAIAFCVLVGIINGILVDYVEFPAILATLAMGVMMVLQYVISALVALVAGLLMSMLVASMNTRIASGTLVYDVILVVVLGGISLSGGRGGIFSVVVGTLLIGIMLNGMTLLNLTCTAQNVIKALVLLLALILDTLINPRDEQTAQQGDI